VQAKDDGNFAISNVYPGTYTLRAFADGVLGEFAQAEVEIAAGRILDLKKIPWTPVRHGRQLWDIGIPNRNSREFLKGDDYYHDGMQALYAELFPDDVHYVVGKGDFTKDIYFQHVPHLDEEASAAAAEQAAKKGQRFFFGPPQMGRATPWTIEFSLPQVPRIEQAIMRLAISGTGTRTIRVSINGRDAGEVQLGMPDSTFSGRNGIQGIWYECELAFDASWLKAGTNTMILTVSAGDVGAGVMYDYLRLELGE
jgi:rhamnogalacturonan endolyase